MVSAAGAEVVSEALMSSVASTLWLFIMASAVKTESGY
jgi:hypothetical protein